MRPEQTNNEMVGPEGPERQRLPMRRTAVFDLPIMSRVVCEEAGK